MEELKRVVLWLALVCSLCGLSLAYPLCLNLGMWGRPHALAFVSVVLTATGSNGECGVVAFKSIQETLIPAAGLSTEAPRSRSARLQFCSAPEYSRNGCCDAAADSVLASHFESMNQSQSQCATVLQQLLCAVSPGAHPEHSIGEA